MNKYNEITKLLFRYEKFGIERADNGTILIGHPNYLPKNWRLVEIYPPLSSDDIVVLREECAMDIPKPYEDFLVNFGNGFNFLFGTFALFGLRKIDGRSMSASRQPFALKLPNNTERGLIKNNQESNFFIGSYDWDGSRLYIDTKTNRVYFCDRYDATPLLAWNSLEDMLIAELTRLYTLFTEDGKQISKNRTTLPL